MSAQVWFPWVKGFTKVNENPKEDLLAHPGQGGNLIKDALDYFLKKRTISWISWVGS